jgi:hypothetical protein
LESLDLAPQFERRFVILFCAGCLHTGFELSDDGLDLTGKNPDNLPDVATVYSSLQFAAYSWQFDNRTGTWIAETETRVKAGMFADAPTHAKWDKVADRTQDLLGGTTIREGTEDFQV